MNASPEPSCLVIHHGGCHCRRVRFEFEAPATIEVLDCNCSICRMSGFLHLIVPSSRFRLTAGTDVLTEYRFHTGVARHMFCRCCGIKSFYVPRSHPDGYSVNVRCLDEGTVTGTIVAPFDDRDREAAMAALAGSAGHRVPGSSGTRGPTPGA